MPVSDSRKEEIARFVRRPSFDEVLELERLIIKQVRLILERTIVAEEEIDRTQSFIANLRKYEKEHQRIIELTKAQKLKLAKFIRNLNSEELMVAGQYVKSIIDAYQKRHRRRKGRLEMSLPTGELKGKEKS